MQTIGDRVREARDSANMDGPALAKLVGFSKQALSQIESSKTKNPKPVHLLKVADATGYELRWLITGKGPKTTKEVTKDKLDISVLPDNSKVTMRAVMDSLAKQKKSDAHHNN